MKWKRPGHWVWSKVLPLDSPALHKEVPHFLALEASRSTLAHSKGVPYDTVSITEQKMINIALIASINQVFGQD